MWRKTTTNIILRSRLNIAKLLFALPVFAIILLISILAISNSSAKATEGEGEKVLSIYDDGIKQAYRTDAKTVGEALKEKGYELSSADSVEPKIDEKLSGTNYNINIYRARPVLIEDGAIRERIMSSGQTPAQIAKDAEIKVFDEDKISIMDSASTIEDGVSSQIKIIRAKLITVNLYGKETQFRTQSATIKDFLSEKNIKLAANDELSLPIDTKIGEGGSFSIWRNGKQTITAEEDIEFDIEKIEDADKDEGFREIKEAGEKGKKDVVYEVEMRNGQEISRTKISEVETKKAKKQVEIVGIKKKGPSKYVGGGSKDEWLRASGIPEQYWAYVDSIVSRESGWNPNATNASSGACGLAQALPCSKVPGNGYNPVDSLRWMNGYVNGRYGGWAGAYNFWQANHWY